MNTLEMLVNIPLHYYFLAGLTITIIIGVIQEVQQHLEENNKEDDE